MSATSEQTALIRRLVESSEAKPLPGVEKAVGEAVTAAAIGAAEGDERLAKALDLLKANKVAEAAELFRAVAADKAARIKQDSKDAAAAYRNLGAIAGLGDPKRALEAYTKAIELDPDDIESLLWVASLEKDRGNLRAGRAALPARPGARYDRGPSLVQVLGAARARRHPKGARQSAGGAEILPRRAGDCRPAGEGRPRQRRLAARSVGVLQQDRRRAGGAGQSARGAANPTATGWRSQTGWPRPTPATPAGSAICRCPTTRSAMCWWRRAICRRR